MSKHTEVKAQSQGFLHDQRKRRIAADVATYILLGVLAVIWLLPIV